MVKNFVELDKSLSTPVDPARTWGFIDIRLIVASKKSEETGPPSLPRSRKRRGRRSMKPTTSRATFLLREADPLIPISRDRRGKAFSCSS